MSARVKQLNTIFTALSHAHRRAIVHRLSLQPSSISRLANELKLSLPAIHKHIVVLERAKLLQRKKVGRSTFLAFNRGGLVAVQRWANQYRTHWGNNKESFHNYVKWVKNE